MATKKLSQVHTWLSACARVVLTLCIVLRASYAMPGTHVPHGASSLRRYCGLRPLFLSQRLLSR
eukprot:2059467-Rhodomonas_salina.1